MLSLPGLYRARQPASARRRRRTRTSPRTRTRRVGAALEARLAASTVLGRDRGLRYRALPRLRPAPASIALALTLLWYAFNVQRRDAIDALPLLMNWLTLWLTFSIGQDLWQRLSRWRTDRRCGPTR